MYDQTSNIRQEVFLTDGIMELPENNFAKILLTKSVKDTSIVVTRQVITPRVGKNYEAGSESSEGTAAKRTSITNTQAIYRDLIKIPRSSMLTDKFGASSEVEAAVDGYKNALENIAINGCTVGTRVTKGLIDFVPTKNKTTIVGEVTGIKLSAALKGLVKDANLIVCGYNAALKFDTLIKQTDVEGFFDGSFHGSIDSINVRNAKAVIVVSNAMKDNEALFLNTAYLSRPYLTNGAVEKISKTTFDGTQFDLTDESCAMYNLPNGLALVTFTDATV